MAWEPIRRFTRAVQYLASKKTYGKLCSASDRSRSAATSASRSAQIRETSDLEMPESPPRALTRSSTFRVEVPCT
jgi:hypothetical protein